MRREVGRECGGVAGRIRSGGMGVGAGREIGPGDGGVVGEVGAGAVRSGTNGWAVAGRGIEMDSVRVGAGGLEAAVAGAGETLGRRLDDSSDSISLCSEAISGIRASASVDLPSRRRRM